MPFAEQPSAGASASATLQFNPTQAGPCSAILEIQSDAENAKLDIPITGNGVSVMRDRDSRRAWTSASVQIGATKAATVTFTNSGLSQASILVNATSTAAEFRVTNTDGSPVSSSATQTLAAGGSYVINVTFAPDLAQNFSSSFSWTNCATCPALPFTLTGLGVQGQLQISPDPIGFSNVPAGQSLGQTLTVTNAGSIPVDVGCVYLKSAGNGSCGVGDAVFGISAFGPVAPSPSAPITLSPSNVSGGLNSFFFTVSYTPSTAGHDADTLAVDFTPQGATGVKTATDPLLGNEALSPCTLQLSPTTLSFGNVTVGQKVVRAATLTNLGQSACAVSQVALDPTSDPSYTLDPAQAVAFAIPAGGAATLTADMNLNNTSAPHHPPGGDHLAERRPGHRHRSGAR